MSETSKVDLEKRVSVAKLVDQYHQKPVLTITDIRTALREYNNSGSVGQIQESLNEARELVNAVQDALPSFNERDTDAQARQITAGRRLDPELVKRLLPSSEFYSADERPRHTGIVITFLSDFKDEEPTASDIDDILEIAKCDVLENRLLKVSRDDPGGIIAITKTLETIDKRKQAAKKNLANRRVDRRANGSSGDVSIVDLVVRYDKESDSASRKRIEDLLREEGETLEVLRKIIEEENVN